MCFVAHTVFFTGARLASAVAGACNVRSYQLLTASMLGALGALGVLYAGSHLAARDGSIWLVWVGAETRLFEPFIYKNAHFTKTGSGQT